MKRALLLTLSAGMTALMFSSYGSGPFQGGAGNRTGSAGTNAGCDGSTCHSSNNAGLGITATLIDNGATVTSYVPGRTYRVVIFAGIQSAFPRFGFQASVVRASDGSTPAGTLAVGRPNTAVRGSGLQVVEQTTPLSGVVLAGNTLDSVSFLWTAPTTGVGTVRVYVAFNAVNFNGTSAGDAPNAATAEFTQGTVGVATIEKAHLAVYPNPVSAALHLKLPANGKNYSVRLWDMAGRMVMAQEMPAVNGEASISTANLQAGNYFILATQDGKQYVTSFTKQ